MHLGLPGVPIAQMSAAGGAEGGPEVLSSLSACGLSGREGLLREVCEGVGLVGNATKGFSNNLSQHPWVGRRGGRVAVFKSCRVCTVLGVADVLFLAG